MLPKKSALKEKKQGVKNGYSKLYLQEKRPMMDLDKSFQTLRYIDRDPNFNNLKRGTPRNIYVGEVG
jgi:hypothetical protein